MSNAIAFENFYLGLEATRGTAVAATHRIVTPGLLTPDRDLYVPEDVNGLLVGRNRSEEIRNETAWTTDGPADVGMLPIWLNMAVVAQTTPTTPTNAVLSRLWTFLPSLSADNIKAATLYWDAGGNQTFRSPFCGVDTLTFTADTSSSDASEISISGMGNSLEKVSDVTPIAAISGAMLQPRRMQIWLDSSSDAIGTTEVTGAKLVYAEHVINTGVTYKPNATGPTNTLGHSRLGRDRTERSMMTTITVEFDDTTLYDLWKTFTHVKLRVRHHGRLIETESATDFYNYVEFDTYGPLTDLSWDEHMGSNRTATFVIHSHYDPTDARDFAVRVQNTRTAL